MLTSGILNKKILELESSIDHWNFQKGNEKQIFLNTFSISNWRESAFDNQSNAWGASLAVKIVGIL